MCVVERIKNDGEKSTSQTAAIETIYMYRVSNISVMQAIAN